MTSWASMLQGAMDAEEVFTLDELEDFAAKMRRKCSHCHGTGKQWRTAINGRIYDCEWCAGTGQVER